MENKKQEDEVEMIELISCNHNGIYKIELKKGKDSYYGENEKVTFALKSALEKITGFDAERINIEFQHKSKNAYVTLFKDFSTSCFEVINGKDMRNYILEEGPISGSPLKYK